MTKEDLVDMYIVVNASAKLLYFRVATQGRDMPRQIILKPIKSILRGTTPADWDPARLANTQKLLDDAGVHRPGRNEKWRPEWSVMGKYPSVTLEEGVELALKYAERLGYTCINVAHMPPLTAEGTQEAQNAPL